MPPSSRSRPVVVLIGPSGSGKSSVVRELHRRGLLLVHPTWTTRPRRADEVADGSVEHRFVDDATFDTLVRQGFFLASAALFGLSYRYGLPTIAVPAPGDEAVADAVMLRAPVLARFAEFVPRHLTYQIDDRPDRIAARLSARGCPPAELLARLQDNRAETAAGRPLADRIFFNGGSLAELADHVAAALIGDCATGPATPVTPATEAESAHLTTIGATP